MSRESALAWAKANREKAQATLAAWRKANPEAVRRHHAMYRKGNKEKLKAYYAAYLKANPEKAAAQAVARRAATAKWRKANPEKGLGYTAERRAHKKNVSVLLSCVERTCIRAFYDTARFLKEITGETFHVDHVIPLSKGGLHHPRNLQVLRGVDNLRKGARI